MLVALSYDDHEYYLSEDANYFHYKIDVTQKFWDRYIAYEAEREFIQSKLHRYYEDCRKQEILKKSKEEGKNPIGF